MKKLALILKLLQLPVFAQVMTNNNIAITINSGSAVTVKGDVQNNSGTTIDNNGTMNISGDWTNNSGNNCFQASAGTVVFNGGAQNIGGTSSTLFNNLNLSGSGTKTMTQSISAGGNAGNGILDVSSFKLDLNSNTLSVVNGDSAAISYTTGMIISEDVDNSSKVAWDINSDTRTHVIPFGNNAGVQIPLSIWLRNGNLGTVTASTYATTANNQPYPVTPTLVTNVNDGYGNDNSAFMVDRFWQVDKTGATATTDIIFRWASFEAPAMGNFPRAQIWNTNIGGWDYALPNQSNPAAQSVYVPFITQYGAWAVASDESPLPVTLTEFNAKVNRDDEVDLTWVTEAEINNDFFTIERSKDGINFREVAVVDGAGSSTAEHHYKATDKHPYDGTSYYRLIQTDYDGNETFSEIRQVFIKKNSNVDITVYPNPVAEQFTIAFNNELSGKIFFDLFDESGRIVMTKEISVGAESKPAYIIERGNLVAGAYAYQIRSNEEVVKQGKLVFN
jgi:hypothetical protein